MKAAPSAFGTSPKYDIESMNVDKALACRIWRRTGAGASLREIQSATGEESSALKALLIHFRDCLLSSFFTTESTEKKL